MRVSQLYRGSIALAGMCAVAACSGSPSAIQTTPDAPLAAVGATAKPSPTPTPKPSPTPTPKPSPTPTPTPKPTATPSVASLTGTVTDIASGAAISGLTVTVGAVPVATSCLAAQTSALNPCGVAASPIAATTTTSGSGAFSLGAIKNGTYLLTIGKPIAFSPNGNYATLHRAITLAGGANSLGAVHLTSIPWPVPVWLETLNNSRSQQSPVSFGNLTIDEYAQEQATAAAAAMTTAKALVTSYTTYGAAYAASAGALYEAIGFSYEANSSGNGPGDVNSVVFGHQSACTPNWTNCTTTYEDYVQAASTRDVWVGLAQPPSSAAGPNYFYSFVIVTDQAGSLPR